MVGELQCTVRYTRVGRKGVTLHGICFVCAAFQRLELVCCIGWLGKYSGKAMNDTSTDSQFILPSLCYLLLNGSAVLFCSDFEFRLQKAETGEKARLCLNSCSGKCWLWESQRTWLYPVPALTGTKMSMQTCTVHKRFPQHDFSDVMSEIGDTLRLLVLGLDIDTESS